MPRHPRLSEYPQILSLLLTVPGIGHKSALAALEQAGVDRCTLFSGEQSARAGRIPWDGESDPPPRLKGAQARALWIITGNTPEPEG